MKSEATDRVGLAVFLASWAMLVAALGFAALALDATAFSGTISTFVPGEVAAFACGLAVLSSVLVCLDRGRLAFASACAFLGSQASLVASAVGGSSQGDHLLGLLGGFHAFHVAVALGGFVYQLVRRRPLGLWGAFWHALAVSWLFFSGVLFL